ncbi:MAG: TIGR00270 family protein [Thermoplasmata archaeon]|nr:MAG: TIGR00270 family protein [Thermoplasmata archaeon]
MICEMCGVDVPNLKEITIEGSNLSVCPKCAKFGQDHPMTKGADEHTYTPTITERLERREKRRTTKDVFEKAQEELALDYPKRISLARTSMGLSQEELGKKINEKKSVVAKLEAGDMIPDEKLIKKLEKALDISLKEKVAAISPPKRKEEAKGMTLGDFIKIKKG